MPKGLELKPSALRLACDEKCWVRVVTVVPPFEGELASVLAHWALIGGLTSSMFLTLVIVPIVYTWVDRMKSVAPAFFKRPFALLRLRRLQSFQHKLKSVPQ